MRLDFLRRFVDLQLKRRSVMISDLGNEKRVLFNFVDYAMLIGYPS